MSSTKRTPDETWKALERQAREAEIDRFRAKTGAEVDASLRASGHDPARVRAEGEALAQKLRADRERLAWQVTAAEGLARAQAKLDARGATYAGMSRADLLDRLAAARKNPKLAQPVAVLFRNRKPEEASEEELRALLEEIDALGEGDE
jgi:hypothetical protein